MNATLKPTPTAVARLMLTPARRLPTDTVVRPDWVERTIDIHGIAGTIHVALAGHGPLIGFVHGWEGSSNDFATLINAVLAAGFSIAALDLPAHGQSSGSYTSIPAAATALLDVQAALGEDFYAVIGHSLGSAVTGEALASGLRAEKVVLIAPPRRYLDAVDGTAAQFGFDSLEKAQLIAALRDLGINPSAVDLTQAVSQLTQPALILHSEDDRVIPIAAAESVAAAWAGSWLIRYQGLGHRRLLSDSALNLAVINFIGSAEDAQS
jgi:pimeloyl-ACP methyl ester carboxylesterase